MFALSLRLIPEESDNRKEENRHIAPGLPGAQLTPGKPEAI
jgi:hypothetical protein